MTSQNLQFLAQLETIIDDRLANPSKGSYTAELATSGIRRIAQKVGEEAVEVVLAAVTEKRSDVIEESADLLFHLLLLLRSLDIQLHDVVATLEARHARADRVCGAQ